jgi:hypothetical protein
MELILNCASSQKIKKTLPIHLMSTLEFPELSVKPSDLLIALLDLVVRHFGRCLGYENVISVLLDEMLKVFYFCQGLVHKHLLLDESENGAPLCRNMAQTAKFDLKVRVKNSWASPKDFRPGGKDVQLNSKLTHFL